MWYYPIITVRILRTNELCVFQTYCSKQKFVISSYLQIEISTHPNQNLPIKLKVNKQLWKIADFNKGNFKLKVMWLIYENDLKLVYSKREIVCKYKSISVRSWQTKTDLDLRNAATFRKITSNYFYSTKLGQIGLQKIPEFYWLNLDWTEPKKVLCRH